MLSNDILLIIGIVAIISTPALAYFDRYDYPSEHENLSYVFFVSVVAYELILTYQM